LTCKKMLNRLEKLRRQNQIGKPEMIIRDMLANCFGITKRGHDGRHHLKLVGQVDNLVVNSQFLSMVRNN